MRLRRRRGASLVIVLVACLLVFAFAASTVVLADVIFRQETDEAERSELERITRGVEAYEQDLGAWPPDLEALRTRPASLPPSQVDLWRGPYALDRLSGAAVDEYQVDVWGRPLQYDAATGRVRSGGRDRTLMTGDDLVFVPRS